jgi:PhoH-like ATPase
MNESFNKTYVLDTNIILSDANNLFKISQNNSNLIVIPETVIDELDTKKSGFDEINFQAREFSRILTLGKVIDIEKFNNNENEISIVKLLINNNLRINIVSFSEYNLKGIDKNILNDRKILEVAKYIKEKVDKNSIFLTLDGMCRIRAISMNLNTDILSYGKKDYDLDFIKELYLTDINVNGKCVLDIDKDYKEENKCYIIRSKNKESKKILAVIKNKKFIVIDENELNKSDIKPKKNNNGQKFALSGMLDPDFNVVLIEALAGSGKTLLAVSAGLRNVQMKRYDKIIYIRNSIESLDKGEEVGFLSGNEEKFKIYNYPLYDVLDIIVRAKKTKKKTTEEEIENRIEEMIEKYNIETMWVGGIRGRTITKSYVIIDEIQNFSKKSLQTVLSRLDSDSKVVCIGSNRQIDNPFINKYTNGLNVLLESTTKENEEVNIFATKLDKVERGKLTQWTEKIFS